MCEWSRIGLFPDHSHIMIPIQPSLSSRADSVITCPSCQVHLQLKEIAVFCSHHQWMSTPLKVWPWLPYLLLYPEFPVIITLCQPSVCDLQHCEVVISHFLILRIRRPPILSFNVRQQNRAHVSTRVGVCFSACWPMHHCNSDQNCDCSALLFSLLPCSGAFGVLKQCFTDVSGQRRVF